MTSPLTADAQAILKASKGINVRSSTIARNKRFVDFVRLLDTLQTQIDDGWSRIAADMDKYDIESIKGDDFSLTMVERRTLRGTPTPSFAKAAIDTKKVRAYVTLTGTLPPGITETTTRSLRKVVK